MHREWNRREDNGESLIFLKPNYRTVQCVVEGPIDPSMGRIRVRRDDEYEASVRLRGDAHTSLVHRGGPVPDVLPTLKCTRYDRSRSPVAISGTNGMPTIAAGMIRRQNSISPDVGRPPAISPQTTMVKRDGEPRTHSPRPSSVRIPTYSRPEQNRYTLVRIVSDDPSRSAHRSCRPRRRFRRLRRSSRARFIHFFQARSFNRLFNCFRPW